MGCEWGARVSCRRVSPLSPPARVGSLTHCSLASRNCILYRAIWLLRSGPAVPHAAGCGCVGVGVTRRRAGYPSVHPIVPHPLSQALYYFSQGPCVRIGRPLNCLLMGGGGVMNGMRRLRRPQRLCWMFPLRVRNVNIDDGVADRRHFYQIETQAIFFSPGNRHILLCALTPPLLPQHMNFSYAHTSLFAMYLRVFCDAIFLALCVRTFFFAGKSLLLSLACPPSQGRGLRRPPGGIVSGPSPAQGLADPDKEQCPPSLCRFPPVWIDDWAFCPTAWVNGDRTLGDGGLSPNPLDITLGLTGGGDIQGRIRVHARVRVHVGKAPLPCALTPGRWGMDVPKARWS